VGVERLNPPVLSRRQRIICLLETYRDVLETTSGDPSTATVGGGSFEDKVLWTESAYRHGGYRELERCLEELQRRCPVVFGHLRARYLHSIKHTKRIQRRSGKWVNVPDNEKILTEPFAADDLGGWYIAKVETWAAWVNRNAVALAVKWIEREYRGDPTIPRELWAMPQGSFERMAA